MAGKYTTIPLSRLIAFSDGVIAIIITLMILSIKVPAIENTNSSVIVWHKLSWMLEPIASYLLSFVTIGVLWVNHHQFFEQLKHSDRGLLWLNLLFLFCMSLVPIPTELLGQNFLRPEIIAFYGLMMFTCLFSFLIMRLHVQKVNLFIENLSPGLIKLTRRKLQWGTALYFASVFTAFLSVYISIAIFVIVAILYFLPTNIEVR